LKHPRYYPRERGGCQGVCTGADSPKMTRLSISVPTLFSRVRFPGGQQGFQSGRNGDSETQRNDARRAADESTAREVVVELTLASIKRPPFDHEAPNRRLRGRIASRAHRHQVNDADDGHEVLLAMAVFQRLDALLC